MKTQTRKVYAFEGTVPPSAYAVRWRTPDELHRMIARVWKREGRPVALTPALRLRPGYTSQAELFTNGTSVITLVTDQQNFDALLHELAHCLTGDEKHGPKFMASFIHLLSTYARMDENELLINAALYGIKVHGFARN